MKTTKGGKVMNPTDAYRKELRKKELKRVCSSPFFGLFIFLTPYIWVLGSDVDVDSDELVIHKFKE